MIKISPYAIPHIERALGIQLYVDQINYLTENGFVPFKFYHSRRTGSTLAYCIKLALSTGQELNLKKPTDFSDAIQSGLAGDDARRYSNTYFLKEFMSVRDKLKQYGFTVRDVTKRRII